MRSFFSIINLRTVDFWCLLFVFASTFLETSPHFLRSHFWLLLISIWGITTVGTATVQFKKIDVFVILGVFYVLGYYAFKAPQNAHYHLNFLKLMAFLVVYLKLITGVREFKDLRKPYVFCYVLLAICIIQSSLGVLQYFEILKSVNPYFKITGSFKSPNHLGVLLSLGLLSLCWIWIYKKGLPVWQKILALMVAGLLVCILALTASRTAFILLLVGLGILTGAQKIGRNYVKKLSPVFKWIFTLLFMLLVGVFVGIFYFIKKDSANGRWLIAKLTFPEIFKSPFGHGLFSFVPNYNSLKATYFNTAVRPWNEIKVGSYTFDTYNEYLFLGYELGVLFILLLGVIGIELFKNSFKATSSQEVLGLVILIPLLIAALFMPVSSLTPLLFLLVIAVAIVREFKGNVIPIKYIPPNFLKGVLLVISLVLGVFSINYIQRHEKITAHFNTPFTERLQVNKTQLSAIYDQVFYKGYAKFNYGYELLSRGEDSLGITLMEQGIALNWAPKLCRNLGYTCLNRGNYKRAETLFTLNAGNEPYRYEPLMDLWHLYSQIHATEKIAQVSKKIIAKGVKIPSKRVDSIKKIAQDYLNAPLHKPMKDISGTLSGWKSFYSLHLQRSSNYQVYLPEGNYLTSKLPVLWVTDGQQYFKDNFFLETIENLIATKKIEPLAIVFLDPRAIYDSQINYRQEYFLCNKNYVDFLTHELMPKLQNQYAFSKKRANQTILGHSFGGLFAAYLGFKGDKYFKNIAMQSPAFHPCPSIYTSYKNNAKLDLKMYLSYGTGNDTENQDLPMIAILQEKGYSLKINRVEGGDHRWKVWMLQMEEIMRYFYGCHIS